MNGRHINTPCPLCDGPLIVGDLKSNTEGMNAVCDACLRPLCLRLARALQHAGGSRKVRILDYGKSLYTGGEYLRVVIQIDALANV